MDQVYFWLNDEQFAQFEPHLPADTRGKPRVDGHRVISGIIPSRSCSPAARWPIAWRLTRCSTRCRLRFWCMGTRAMTPMPCAARSKPRVLLQTPTKSQPGLDDLLLAVPLSEPQRDRAQVRASLKDFRRIEIRCYRLARNFRAAVCIAAVICCWL